MPRTLAAGFVSVVVFALVAFPGVASADFTATEGQSFSGQVINVGSGCGITNPTIVWGDGMPTSAGTPTPDQQGVLGTHTYAEEGTYNGSVSYTCNQSGMMRTTAFQATVQDAPLTGAGRNISGTAGQSLTAVVAHIDDANSGGSASDFAAQIAWGDGTTTAGSVTSAAGGGFDVVGTHTYNSAGSYPVNSSITDIGGSSTTASSTAQIGAAAAQPPRIIAAPVVSGVAHETDTLTTTTGFWSGSPSDYQYQWLRCATPTGDNCAVVAGATASTYTPVHADVGSTMRSRVRAHNAVGTSLPADSAPTAVVTPLVLTASFTMTPNPSCTGLTVTFDASASVTPNPPIERYRFTESVDPSLPDYTSPPPPDWVISDGASAQATEVPTYDSVFVRQLVYLPAVIPVGVWLANNRSVTLTVRDRAGATASYTLGGDDDLRFDPAFSNASRAHCPHLGRRVRARVALRHVQFRVTRTTVNLTPRCTTSADCAGTLGLTLRASRGRRHARTVVIGTGSFYLTGHRSATISAKLTAAGRRLLGRGKPLVVIARLITISPSGQTTTQSLTVTLIGKKKRR
jgi:hypothetical protein